MADNVNITAGTGTAIAADDIGSAYYQRIKLVDGTEGSNNPLVIGSLGAYVEVKSMPITTIVNGSEGFTQPVSGTFWQLQQPIVNGSPGFIQAVSGFPSVQLVTLGSTGIAIPVSGTFWQTTQPVSIATPYAIVNGSAGWIQPVSHAGVILTTLGSTGITIPTSLATVPVHPVTLGSGAALIGAVTVGSAGFTQPVSHSGVITITNGSGNNLIGNMTIGSSGWRQPVTPYEVSSNLVNGVINNWPQLANASPQLLIPAPGAGVSFHMTNFTIVNSNGSIGSSIALANVYTSPMFYGYAAGGGGGFATSFPAPIKTPGLNEAVYLALGTASANFYGTVSGYKA